MANTEHSDYKITFRKRAAKEYIEALLSYKERSLKAAGNFNEEVQITLSKIVTQPNYFHRTYKDFREALTKRFPFFIIYFVDENNSRL